MATWSTAYINDLPDSAFACVNSSGRHYPHHNASGAIDMPHLRAAMSRIGDASNEQCGKGHLMSHGKAEGMGKGLLPIKAQPMDDEEWTAFFAGRKPMRLLAIPFGGPIPSPKSAKGVDLDGEWFDEDTDIYGTIRGLRETRERLVDWHHGRDVTGVMRRVTIAKSILDPSPEEDGWWSEVWIKLGEKRVALIEQLKQRGAQLFGSSEAAYKKADPDGHIKVWPMVLQTLTTSPQNTYSVLRPSKAMLDEIEPVDPALRRVLEDLEALGDDLTPTLRGEVAAKAGRFDLSESLEPWEALRRRT